MARLNTKAYLGKLEEVIDLEHRFSKCGPVRLDDIENQKIKKIVSDLSRDSLKNIADMIAVFEITDYKSPSDDFCSNGCDIEPAKYSELGTVNKILELLGKSIEALKGLIEDTPDYVDQKVLKDILKAKVRRLRSIRADRDSNGLSQGSFYLPGKSLADVIFYSDGIDSE